VLLPTDTGARSRDDLLLTGSTGFLGMELLARLLEGTDRRVWAPVRAEDDAEAAARLRATLATLVPDPGMYSDRVVAFAADLTRPRLGLDARRRDETPKTWGRSSTRRPRCLSTSRSTKRAQ
jgi:thioester reductase-like protein